MATHPDTSCYLWSQPRATEQEELSPAYTPASPYPQDMYLTGPEAVFDVDGPWTSQPSSSLSVPDLDEIFAAIVNIQASPIPSPVPSPVESPVHLSIGAPYNEPVSAPIQPMYGGSSSLAHALDPPNSMLDPPRGRPSLSRLQINSSPRPVPAATAPSAPPSLHIPTPVIVAPHPPTPPPVVHLAVPGPPHHHVRRRSESSLFPKPTVEYQLTAVQSASATPSPGLLSPPPLGIQRARSLSDGRPAGQHGRSKSDTTGLLSPGWQRSSRGPSRSPSTSSSRRSSPYPGSRSVSPCLSRDGVTDVDGDSLPTTPISVEGVYQDQADTIVGSTSQEASPRPIVKAIVTSDKVAEASIRRRRNTTEDARFKCEHCGRCLTSKHNLDGHIRSHNDERPFPCEYPPCDKSFSRKSDRKRHQETVHQSLQLKCEKCDGGFSRKDALSKHAKTCGQHLTANLHANAFQQGLRR